MGFGSFNYWCLYNSNQLSKNMDTIKMELIMKIIASYATYFSTIHIPYYREKLKWASTSIMQNEIFIAIFGILSICRSYNLCWIGILTISSENDSVFNKSRSNLLWYHSTYIRPYEYVLRVIIWVINSRTNWCLAKVDQTIYDIWCTSNLAGLF